MQFRPWLALPLCILVAAACGSAANEERDDDGDGNDKPKEALLVGAPGVRITQVAIYQGPKRVLMLDGFPGQSNVPLVAGRDALVRVFYATEPGYNGGEVVGRLQIEGAEPIEAKQVLYGASADPDLASSVNFFVPGVSVGPTLVYSVGLLQEGKAEGDNLLARWPAQNSETVAVDGPQNTFRLRLVPFQYNADGSGRLPDVSPEQVERFRQRFRALYPVSNVEVSVHDPIPWNQGIQPNGQGWQEVGYKVFGLRQQENAPDDLYYYALFNPANSLYQFCGSGCLLGVTLLNDQPLATGEVDLRLALGVGFNEVALDTAAHEIGHAHGRPHADCGYGLDPSSIDHDFPHPNGGIGVWGYDVTSGALVDPAQFTDIMGYCETQFISDYNYNNLLQRGKNVNAALKHAPMQTVEYDLIGIDEGSPTWRTRTGVGRPVSGHPLEVSVQDDNGQWRSVSGRFVRYDHLPGGWLFVPRADADFAGEAKRAEFVLDGKMLVAER
jgi:hypothetical protein